jgi:predicted PurR-regulated permease PerM
MSNEKLLDISWGTILKVAISFFCFYLVYLVRDILIWFIFALIIAILFNPAIDFLQRKKVPRLLAAGLIYILFLGILGLSIYLIAPAFISEIQQFSQLFSQYFEKLTPPLKQLGIGAFEDLESFTLALQEWLTKASSNIFSAMAAIFGGIFATSTIFALSLFISLEEKGIERVILLFTPKRYENQVLTLLEKSQQKVSGWFGARILCCFFVGLMTFLALKLFNIKYAFFLSLFAGVTNIIPILGPIFAGVIITILALLDYWPKALFILIAFILIQQIEGSLLTPILTKKFIGLPPVFVLLAVLMGGKLWGILGAILAIPITGIIFEFLRDFLKKRKSEEAQIEVASKKTIVW